MKPAAPARAGEHAADLSKIEAGKLELNLRDIALRPLLEACASLLRPEVERKSQRFALDIAPGTPVAVEADPMRMRQMLLNCCPMR
jgi:signal transduction histidine kinase